MDKNPKTVIRKQSHSDHTQWHPTDALSDRCSGWFRLGFTNFPKHQKSTSSPGIPRLFPACKNLNFFTNTFTLLPCACLMPQKSTAWLINQLYTYSSLTNKKVTYFTALKVLRESQHRYQTAQITASHRMTSSVLPQREEDIPTHGS